METFLLARRLGKKKWGLVKSWWRLCGPWKGQLGKTHPLNASGPSLLGRVIPTSTACIGKAETRSSLSLQTGLFTPGQTVIYPQAWAPPLVVGPAATPVPAPVVLGTCSWSPGLGASLRNSPVQEDHAAEGLQDPLLAGAEVGRALLRLDGASRGREKRVRVDMSMGQGRAEPQHHATELVLDNKNDGKRTENYCKYLFR